MFKKFLITVCGSFVGSFIAILVSMFFMMMLGVAIAAGFGNIKTNVQNHSILVLDLSGAITERPTGAGKIDEVRYMFGEEPGISLQEIERALDVAMLENKIDGVGFMIYILVCDSIFSRVVQWVRTILGFYICHEHSDFVERRHNGDHVLCEQFLIVVAIKF